MIKILVAIPTFNEDKFIEKVLKEICNLTTELSLSEDFVFQVGLFDDGSTDHTVLIAKKYPIFIHEGRVNKGLGNNFQEIVNHAINMGVDYLITVDGDDQFYISEIKYFLTLILTQQSDLILGSRFRNGLRRDKQIPKVKIVGNYLVAFFVSIISGFNLSDATCGFRAYSRRALYILNPAEKFSYTLESLLQILNRNIKPAEVPINVKYFKHRKSTVSGSILKYGLKTSKILIRQLFTSSLKRFSGLFALFIPLGLMLGILFVLRSSASGTFYGNLYLGFLSGFSIILGAVASIVFTLNYKIDYYGRYIENSLSMGYPEFSIKCPNCDDFS